MSTPPVESNRPEKTLTTSIHFDTASSSSACSSLAWGRAEIEVGQRMWDLWDAGTKTVGNTRSSRDSNSVPDFQTNFRSKPGCKSSGFESFATIETS